ncbi:MAG: bifunctional phosphopantothenoylcysteine decarboxylase/phosphopantothenate--cysteine ligase CoaBC [Sphaerobacteraceae bacterium]|nr:MAG: bifunctional phosphopantothenoylcysteine decarboxylase/phosphopantothenate--cysteine ligase CoaBC [Sphaerobacteraceae bacterium]
MPSILENSRVLLGVSGGIAAYKTIELVRLLRKAGSRVDVVMTRAAEAFVTPLTFETLTRQPVRTDVIEQWTDTESGHVTLAEQADIMVVAPATANTIAKLAHGLSDDMLSVSALACPAPLLVAPAMDHHMFLHPATQANLATLRDRGAHIIGPDDGELASGIIGHGRLVPPEAIFGAIRQILGQHKGRLIGKHVVISAGATREPLDPIRFISNRSSGLMGYAIAQALVDAGADTTLVTSAQHLDPPVGANVIDVVSAADMYSAVSDVTPAADALIMAAAVGDYAAKDVGVEKMKKSDDDLTIELARTVDILATIDRPGLIKVGFAAETTNLVEYASKKLVSKGASLLVANDARQAMGSNENQAIFFKPDVEPEHLPMMTKHELARRIVDELANLIDRQPS